MMKKNVKRILCGCMSAMLLACTPSVAALAADTDVAVTASVGSNVVQSGPLTIESHLQARMGYPQAYYTVYVYAPSDVVGISINDMDILESNAVILQGAVNQVGTGTGVFENITVKVTLYYADGSTYTSYETIDVNHWCAVHHPASDHCTI